MPTRHLSLIRSGGEEKEKTNFRGRVRNLKPTSSKKTCGEGRRNREHKSWKGEASKTCCVVSLRGKRRHGGPSSERNKEVGRGERELLFAASASQKNAPDTGKKRVDRKKPFQYSLRRREKVVSERVPDPDPAN